MSHPTREEALNDLIQCQGSHGPCACSGKRPGQPLCGCDMRTRGVYFENDKWHEIKTKFEIVVIGDEELDLEIEPLGQTQNVKVVMEDPGPNRIEIMKAIRESTGLGIMESKKIIDDVPNTFINEIWRGQAVMLKDKLTELGATVSFIDIEDW